MSVNRYLAIRQEDPYKQVHADTSWEYFDINSCDISGPTEQTGMYPTAATRMPRFHAPGIYTLSGTITIPVDAGPFGWILKGVFGNVESTEIGDSGFYTHVFTPASELPSWLVAQAKDYFEHQFQGILFNELSLELSDRFLIANISCVGAEDSRADLQGDVGVDDFPDYVFHTLKSSITKNEVGESAEDVSSDVQNFSFSVNNNVDLESGIPVNTRFPARHFAQSLTVSGTLTLAFEDDSALREFWGANTGPHEDTVQEMQLEVSFVEVENEKELTIRMPRALVQSHSAPVSGRDYITQTMEYAGLVDDTEEASMVVELTNDTAEYPDPTPVAE